MAIIFRLSVNYSIFIAMSRRMTRWFVAFVSETLKLNDQFIRCTTEVPLFACARVH